LRARGVCPAALVVTTAADDLVAHFAQHLQDQQGLAGTTIERYCWIARQFLHHRFGRGAVDLRLLRAGDAIAFVKRESQQLQAPALKCVTNGLRSLLRYAQFRGEVPAALATALPHLTAWRGLCASFGVEPAEAAVQVARTLAPDAVLVLGAERREQLDAAVAAAERPLPAGFLETLEALPPAPPAVVDPRRWAA